MAAVPITDPSYLARKLLATNLGGDADSTLDSNRLGIDSGLLSEPALLPMGAARQLRYQGTPIIPDRNQLFVTATAPLLRGSSPDGSERWANLMAEKLGAFQVDRPEEAHQYPAEPYPVQGQVAELLGNILNLQPRPMRALVAAGDGAQVIGIASTPGAAPLARKHCSALSTAGKIALDSHGVQLVAQLLARSGVHQESLRSVSCTGNSMLVSGIRRRADESRWTLVLTPTVHSPVSGVLFVGFGPTLHVESVGNKANPSIYIARNVEGNGGFLTSFVVDAARPRILASIHQLPDGELEYFLRSGNGPVYLLVRQSVITSARGIRAAAPKRTLTAVVRWAPASARYDVVNVRLSRHSSPMVRAGILHPSQLPGTITELRCEQKLQANNECETGPEALLAEAEAHAQALDPRGATLQYGEYIQRYAARLLAGPREQHMTLLEVQQKHAVALFSSEQYDALAALCAEQQHAAWVKQLERTVSNAARSGCENLLGMANRLAGNYAAAKEHFERAFLLDPLDAAPFGNLIRHRLDVNQPRQALGMLTSRLFDPEYDTFYTRFQALQFARALSEFNRSPAALLFLLPDEDTSRQFFGLTLATAGGVMHRASDRDLSLLLLDEALHYVDGFGLRELGPELLLDYARTLAGARRLEDAHFILQPLMDPSVSVNGPLRARALDLMAAMALGIGDACSGPALVDECLGSAANKPAQR